MQTMQLHPGTTPADTLALLDDHHLVVAGRDAHARARFAEQVTGYLRDVVDAELIVIDGAQVRDAHTLAARFTTRHRGRSAMRSEAMFYPQAREIQAVIDRLRSPGRRPRRIVVWTEAHTMMHNDLHLFSWVVNAITSVAIEGEHLGAEDLALLRAIFIGSEALAHLANDETGPFQRWQDMDLSPGPRMVSWDPPPSAASSHLHGNDEAMMHADKHGSAAHPGSLSDDASSTDGFWEAASCVDRPPVRLMLLD